MPESRWITQSVRKPNPSRSTVTWPEYPPWKYLLTASAIRAFTRSRNAPPISMFLPETRNGIVRLLLRRSADRRVLLPPPLHRRGDAHRLPVFCDGAAGDVDTGFTQLVDDGVVRQRLARALGVDQLLDAVAYRFGRMRVAAVRRRDRRGEEVLQLEDAPRRRHEFVGGDPRYRGLVHADGVGDGAQIERAQVLYAVGEERVLLAHDLARDLDDGARPLVERADQPGGILQAIGEIGFFLGVARRLR